MIREFGRLASSSSFPPSSSSSSTTPRRNGIGSSRALDQAFKQVFEKDPTTSPSAHARLSVLWRRQVEEELVEGCHARMEKQDREMEEAVKWW